MFLYMLLLSLVAFVAYVIGSIGTLRVAGQFVFHRNLSRLGRGNLFISNFRRLFGIPGVIKLTLVEIVKDLLPILFGALLISFRGRADIGRLFAGYCLMLGRLWPVFNRFRGSHGCIALILIGLFVDPTLGVTAAVGIVAGIWVTKSLTVGAVAGAVAMAAVAVMVVEPQLILILTVLVCLLVVVHHIPGLRRFFLHQEEKLSRTEDLSYKFDEKF